MRRISDKSLAPGTQIPGALRDETGRVLLPAGAALTDEVLARIQKHTRLRGLYAGDDWPDDASGRADVGKDAGGRAAPTILNPHEAGPDSDLAAAARIAVDSLTVGQSTLEDLYDESGVLLLAAGNRITPRFLHLLQQRRIRTVRVVTNRKAVSRWGQGDRSPGPSAPLSLNNTARMLNAREMAAEIHRGLLSHGRATAQVEWSYSELIDGRPGAMDPLRVVLSGFVESLALDSSLLALLVAMKKCPGEYLYDHALNAALMSLTIGARLGYSGTTLRNIGLSSICHDIGMLSVPEEIRLAPRALMEDERKEVHRHVGLTAAALERIVGLPSAIHTIVAQVHERCDGSGYPAGRSGLSISAFARIVAVADAYSAMIHNRPHRAALLPYDAICNMLHDTAKGRFDAQVVRALLDGVSVFPVGSGVKLTDGRMCRVVRARIGAHTRPVVAEVDEAGRLREESIDLSQETSLRIEHAMPLPPGEAAML